MKPIIKVENLSKQYKLGGEQKPYSTLRESLIETAQKPLKVFKRSQDREKNSFWALKDVNFEVLPGEVVGIIGRNGAGKSTLLKILSRITEPTKGRIELYGRIGSLLEVGTGFHPELTGRENIFLNGAILGMRREEITKKFDEIVDFAEVEQFLDTPVKHYSSGMYTRLAFAVAANLEPEVLVVDEVLAVGDAEFQKKCLGKMKSVSENDGKTVLFVSHNLGAVSNLCNKGILLNKGSILINGNIDQVIASYVTLSQSKKQFSVELVDAERYGTGKAKFTSLKIFSGDNSEVIQTGDDVFITIELRAYQKIEDSNAAVIIYDAAGNRIIDVNTAIKGDFVSLNENESACVEFQLKNVLLKPGNYNVGLWLGRSNMEETDSIPFASGFLIEDSFTNKHTQIFPGVYQCDYQHKISKYLI